MFPVLRRFMEWVAVGVLKTCVSGRQKLVHFWKWWGSLSLSFVITTGCATLRCAWTSLSTNELNFNRQGANRLLSEMCEQFTAFERNFRLWELQMWSNNMTHLPFCERKSPLMIRNTQKRFSLFSKNPILVFKTYARIRPQSTYFQCHVY
jgi:hypothetical protein